MIARGPDCPSDLRLDQLRAGELSASAAASVLGHCSGCSRCTARMAALGQDEATFLARDPTDAVAAIHAASGGRVPDAVAAAFLGKPTPATSWRHALWSFIGVASACGIAFAVWPRGGLETTTPGASPPPIEEVVRTKGSIGLIVHRERAGQVRTMMAGDSATAGDRLRYEVDLPADGFAMVLGKEALGETYVSYPTVGARAAPARGGDDQMLPGAAELDDSVGQEHLALVWCPTPFSSDSATWQGTAVKVPAGCRSTIVDLVKSAP